MSTLVEFNVYLKRLTKFESSLSWFWALNTHWQWLWIVSCGLITAIGEEDIVASIPTMVGSLGYVFIIMTLVLLVALFIFTGTQVTSKEIQQEYFGHLPLTNLSEDTIFWSLVMGAIYRARVWLTWVIGGGPFFLLVICMLYMVTLNSAPTLRYLSPLGNSFHDITGTSLSVIVFDCLWFLSITLSVLGIGFLAIVCGVSFTLKFKNAVSSAAGAAVLTVPFILVLVLIVAPEGYLWMLSLSDWNATVGGLLFVGVVIAVLPFAVALFAQRLLRNWAYA